jgi:transcriptional regulator with XRE-family HTH domain
MLRDAREAKGLTLEDVSRKLFIRKSAIGAMESGTGSSCPIRLREGYVTQYASYLKVLESVKPILLASPEPPMGRSTSRPWCFRKPVFASGGRKV